MKKVILISGASDGLGKATAEKLAKNHQVIISSRDAKKTQAVAKALGVDFVVMDVTNYDQIEAAVKQVIDKHGKIDTLINNAGIWIEGPLESNEPQRIKQVMEVNSLGTIWLTRAVLPFMKQTGNGKIINIISQAGISYKADRSVYDASKWAITGFTKCLQEELKETGVSVSGVYPGSIKTHLFTAAGNDRDMSNYMDISEVVRAVEFIVETSDKIIISELGLKPRL